MTRPGEATRSHDGGACGEAGGAPWAGNCPPTGDVAPAGDAPAAEGDAFELFDLRVEVVQGDRPMVCSHHVGDYFLVEGENLVFPQGASFSMYALAAILPMLPAKERPLQDADWMLSDAYIACPDPNCGARFKITRTRPRVQSHAACTAVPLPAESRKEA